MKILIFVFDLIVLSQSVWVQNLDFDQLKS